jgi:hypothetical protein
MDPILEAAVGLSEAEVAALDDRTLVALADAVEAHVGGDPIVKESDRERALEREMTRELDDEYLESFDEAIEPELALHPEELTADEAGMVVRGVGDRIEADLEGDRGVRMREIVGVGAAAMMVLGRRAGIAGIADSGRPTAGISGSLSLPDRAAVSALSGQQLFWIGRLWNDHLSKTISATVRREALGVGLGREEVGRIMRGVLDGSVPGVAVPGAWRGGSESYFTMLAGTVRNQASNFGALDTFVEAGVTRYRIVAVLDRRTSRICNFMHGRTFEVRTGVRNMTARLEAETPEDARAAAPWRSVEQTELLPGFSENPEDALARAGMALPPYHGNCRTTITPD